MTYILSQKMMGEKHSKWIFILEEFNLEFMKSKSKNSLVFVELICDLPSTFHDYIPNESLSLIDSYYPWYGDIIIYL